MGDDDDGVGLAKLAHELLDPESRHRVECRRRLVHQDDLGIGRQNAGDAEALLLAARKRQTGLATEVVLDLVPQSCPLEAGLDQTVERPPVVLPAAARAVGDVLVDGHRERVGALEDHADTASQLHDAYIRVHDVLAVEADLALDAGARDQVVHPVEAAQERRLAAAGRADQRQDRAGLDDKRDVAYGDLLAVKDGHVLGRYLDLLGSSGELIGRAGRSHLDAPEHGLRVDGGCGHLVSGAHAAVSRRVRTRPIRRAPRLKISTIDMRMAEEPSTI